MNVYEMNGYENRANYLVYLAEEYDVDLNDVMMMADLLGPNEDFDGLVNAVEDLADGNWDY